MSGATPSVTQRIVLVLFSLGVVLIAGAVLLRDLKKHGMKSSTEESRAQLLKEMQGGVDVGKASISPEYLREVVESDKIRNEDPKNPEIRRSLKERAFDFLHSLEKGK